ncbi:MAG: hypothetical protein QOG56_1436 [Solirubrobacteraceae bacterium]|nr:hypothetical protein [Solirubrobacteraceae bacterium]
MSGKRPALRGRACAVAGALIVALPALAGAEAGKVTSASRVSVAGLGPIKIGMTERQAERAGQVSLTGTGSGPDCRYLFLRKGTIQADLMLNHGRIVRVDLVRRGLRTTGDIRIGDSEASVRRRFAGWLRITPAKFVVGGFDLEVRPRNRSERNRRLIFGTNGRKVVAVQAGRLPEVRLVERCG